MPKISVGSVDDCVRFARKTNTKAGIIIPPATLKFMVSQAYPHTMAQYSPLLDEILISQWVVDKQDSVGELVFCVGHELAHAYQNRIAEYWTNPKNESYIQRFLRLEAVEGHASYMPVKMFKSCAGEFSQARAYALQHEKHHLSTIADKAFRENINDLLASDLLALHFITDSAGLSALAMTVGFCYMQDKNISVDDQDFILNPPAELQEYVAIN